MAMNDADVAKGIAELRKKPYIKECFDCGDKGPSYVCLNEGVFVCNACSEHHRHLSHRSVGVSMTTFKAGDLENLTRNGNKNAKKIWMAGYKPGDKPGPDPASPEAMRAH